MNRSGPRRTGLHDVPTAAELVAAVREFLNDQVLDEMEGSIRFHTRVAINALGIVERELEQGDADLCAHTERLASLGYSDDTAFAAAIRSGAEDGRYVQVKAAISASVEAKLRVANPDYLISNPRRSRDVPSS